MKLKMSVNPEDSCEECDHIMTSRYLEVEAKFAVAQETPAPPLTQIDSIEATSPTVEHHLSAIYYDTQDLRLTHSKITLRRRTGGKDDGWHIKMPAAQGRTEIHAPLTEGDTTVPAELLVQVRAIVRRDELVPIAQVDNDRRETQGMAADGTLVAEFTDDHVTAWSLLPGGTKTQWREWEFELAEELAAHPSGQDILQRATAVLISAGGRKSASPSKLMTALGDSIHNVPSLDVLSHCDPESPEYAVLSALRTNRDKLVDYDSRVRNDEWDSIHQMRVATRELRSHMQVFEGILDGEKYHHVERELQRLARILGEARDAEVVAERFKHLIDTDDAAIFDAATRQHLHDDMTQVYATAYKKVIAALDSQRYLDLLDALDDILRHPPVAQDNASEPLDSEAPSEPRLLGDENPHPKEEILYQHLDTAYRKLMKRHQKAVRHWSDPSIELSEREQYFHDMRKAGKKLRYAAEAIGHTTELKTTRLYKACKELQSILGDFQDCVTSRDMLLRQAAQARQAGEDTFGYGVAYERERQAGLEALKHYPKIMKKISSSYDKLSTSIRKSEETR